MVYIATLCTATIISDNHNGTMSAEAYIRKIRYIMQLLVLFISGYLYHDCLTI